MIETHHNSWGIYNRHTLIYTTWLSRLYTQSISIETIIYTISGSHTRMFRELSWWCLIHPGGENYRGRILLMTNSPRVSHKPGTNDFPEASGRCRCYQTTGHLTQFNFLLKTTQERNNLRKLIQLLLSFSTLYLSLT